MLNDGGKQKGAGQKPAARVSLAREPGLPTCSCVKPVGAVPRVNPGLPFSSRVKPVGAVPLVDPRLLSRAVLVCGGRRCRNTPPSTETCFKRMYRMRYATRLPRLAWHFLKPFNLLFVCVCVWCCVPVTVCLPSKSNSALRYFERQVTNLTKWYY